jgi:hypothetical protein
MKRVTLLAPLACLVAGCGGGSTHVSASGEAACAAAVVRGGVTYYGTIVRRGVPRGASAGTGELPPCRDTNVASTEPAQTVDLDSIQGVDPELAVLVSSQPRTVYVAAGTFPQLPGHPLHALLYGSPAQPNERRPWCDLSRTVEVDGVAEWAFASIVLHDGRDPIFVDARTHFTGEPRVKAGEPVKIRALECRHAGDAHYRKLVALEVEPG